MNRQQRRAAQAQNRGLAAVSLNDLFRPDDGEHVPVELMVDRAVAFMESRFGRAVPPERLEGFRNRIRAGLRNAERVESRLEPASTVHEFSDEQHAEGRARFAEMLPRARAHVRDTPACSSPWPGLPGLMREAGLRLADVESILVYPSPAGAPKQGWHGDVLFGREIARIGNTIGTRSDDPAKSPEDAAKNAFEILVALVRYTGEDA